LFLFLLEAIVLLGGISAALFVHVIKYKKRYQSAQQELADSRTAHAAQPKQPEHKTIADMPATAARPAATKEPDNDPVLKARVAELEVQLEKKEKLMKSLEAKFADLEKEYVILYQQQQTSQPDFTNQ
jgi:hypothetical protein